MTIDDEVNDLMQTVCAEELLLKGAKLFPLDEARSYGVIENDAYTIVYDYHGGWYRPHGCVTKDAVKSNAPSQSYVVDAYGCIVKEGDKDC